MIASLSNVYRRLLGVLVIGLLFIPADRLWGGVKITTRTGTTLEGSARLDNGQIIVTTGGQDTPVALADIASATFADDAPTTAPVSSTQPPEDPGGGLKGQYFAKPDFTEPRFSRTDPTAAFVVGYAKDAIPVDQRMFSIRWTGQFKPHRTEHYWIRPEEGSMMRVWLNDRLVLDYRQPVAALSLPGGKKCNIKIETFSDLPIEHVRLLWAVDGATPETIPTDQLYLPPHDLKPLPTVFIAQPAPEQFLVASKSVTLTAVPNERDGTIVQTEFFLSDRKRIGSLKQTPWQTEWDNFKPGDYTVDAIATDDKGQTARSAPVHFYLADNGAGTLPASWGDVAVGSGVGQARFAADAFTIRNSHGDLWGDSDSMHLAVQPLHGDGQIVAHLASLGPAALRQGACAGIIFRQNGRPKSAYDALLVNADGQALFMRHRGDAADSDSTAATSPIWLKLSRSGNDVVAYRSRDGMRWELIGSDIIDMHDALIGLAVMGKGDQEAEAVFDHVTVTAGPPAPTTPARGIVTLDGSIVAGEISSADDIAVGFFRDRSYSVPTPQVASILFRALTDEQIAAIPAHRQGVLLKNGDFFEGAIKSLTAGKLTVSSLLFGLRTFDIAADVAAVVLHDTTPAPGNWAITTTDGSRIHGSAVQINHEELTVKTESLGDLPLAAHELRSISPAKN